MTLQALVAFRCCPVSTSDLWAIYPVVGWGACFFCVSFFGWQKHNTRDVLIVLLNSTCLYANLVILSLLYCVQKTAMSLVRTCLEISVRCSHDIGLMDTPLKTNKHFLKIDCSWKTAVAVHFDPQLETPKTSVFQLTKKWYFPMFSSAFKKNSGIPKISPMEPVIGFGT